MLAFVFAAISLSSIDPDPIVTPAAQIHDRITAGTGFAPAGPAAASGLTSDITVAPACTFGAPQFGTSLWNDAASLARLTQPACSFAGANAPWLPTFGNGFVQLEPTLLRAATNGTTSAHGTASFVAPLPARFTAPPGPIAHGSGGTVLRANAIAGPIGGHAPSGAPRITERRH